MAKIIFVNDVAATEGGALTILKQFLQGINLYSKKDYIYYVFCSKNDLKKYESKNIHIVCNIKGKKWVDRIKWDFFGLKQWSKKYHIKADLIISLQNTGVKYLSYVPQLIYIHQPLPFTNYVKWNYFKHNEQLLWFYKHIYKYIIKYSLNKNSFAVVQTNVMKEVCLKQLPLKSDRVLVINPSFENIDVGQVPKINFNDNKFHIFYPASTVLYKNHELIIKALGLIEDINPEIFNNLKVHFTFKESGKRNKGLVDLINKLGVQKVIQLEGNLPYEKVLSLYKSCDLVVFPSYVESFALPLRETALFGLPLLVSDIPLGREVIGKYSGAQFLDYRNSQQWAQAIIDVYKHRPHFKLYKAQVQNSWRLFFGFVEQLLEPPK